MSKRMIDAPSLRAGSAPERQARARRLLGGVVRPVPRRRPVLDRIVEERAGELKLVKVNIDEEQELAERYGVASIPTIILLQGRRSGRRRDRRTAEGRDREGPRSCGSCRLRSRGAAV